MIAIGDDNQTIYVTRGDKTMSDFNILSFQFPIYNVQTQQEELYEFQLTDKITFVVHDRKAYTQPEILRKDYTIADLGYTEATTTPEIRLTADDTKLFDLLNKGKTYWYDIVLNDTTTILGFDDDGGKKLIVYPEAEEDT